MSNADTHHYKDVAEEALAEVTRARAIGHGPMHSAHEGYAVILEEVEELWAEMKDHLTPETAQWHADVLKTMASLWALVKGHRSLENVAAMRKEAIQVAAMGIAFVVEVCDATS